MTDPAQHPDELHNRSVGSLLNVLRAGVLGGQDGIISTAGIVVGVAGASLDSAALLIAGLAGLVSGALSMAGGEYVSVSSQRDTEKALLDQERWELANMPEEELAELAGLYEEKGLSAELAQQVAVQLHENDALAAHAEIELGIDAHEFTNPWHAAVSSAISFAIGAALPLLAITLSPPDVRVYLTFIVVVAALIGTGLISARVGGAPRGPAVLRNVVVGVITMVVTFGIGSIVGLWI
ncbi:MAG TPA: VIT family protein [Homoserinimonas sp.]|nr:VIT family protein [Homoserinimonas sp.]